MRGVLDEESVKLDGYRTQLGELETESEDVVGGVTLANFRKVRQRFYDLVLRADVGTSTCRGRCARSTACASRCSRASARARSRRSTTSTSEIIDQPKRRRERSEGARSRRRWRYCSREPLPSLRCSAVRRASPDTAATPAVQHCRWRARAHRRRGRADARRLPCDDVADRPRFADRRSTVRRRRPSRSRR